MPRISAEDRIAPPADQPVAGPVTLINRFRVRPDQDKAFFALWTQTSSYFRAQPGFVSLRLHRALSADGEFRWVNVANWESEDDFRAAHSTAEFRRVVTQPAWQEFPSSPMLFEVVTAVG